MSQEPKDKSAISYEELRRLAEDRATPIDFDALIQAGVIEKKGAWYQINDWNALPEHARAKISVTRSGDKLLVKFRAPSKRLAKFLKDEEK